MKRLSRSPAIVTAALLMLLSLTATGVLAENIVAPNKYAWGENVGWVNTQPGGPGGVGMTVTNTDVKGYMWGENIGWVNLSCLTNATCGGAAGTWGVKNDGAGTLAGYAWSENAGWINFSCLTNSACGGPAGAWGVKVSTSTGVFSGDAWSENTGWLRFNSSSPTVNFVKTSWMNTSVGGVSRPPARDNLPPLVAQETSHSTFALVASAASAGALAAAVGGWFARRRRPR